MFSFTRKTDYALVALARLAEQTAAQGEPISARHIAQQYGLPLPLLMNILKDLQRAKLVASNRGAKGGYYLTQPPEKINIADVVLAIEGPMRVTACCEPHQGSTIDHKPAAETVKSAQSMEVEGTDHDCRMRQSCPITGPIKRLHYRLNEFLHQVTLADLINSNVDVPVSHVGVAVLS